MRYEVVFARSARKELESITLKIAERIFHKIEGLALNPRPTGCTKLKGEKNLWRIRVGDYRVIYSIFEDRKLVDISMIRHRRDVYR